MQKDFFRRFAIVKQGDEWSRVYHLIEEKGLTREDLEMLLTGLKMKDEPDPVPFKEYLISMVGKKMAMEIIKMTKSEKAMTTIIIDGRQGPTGKSTLKRILESQGYKVLEMYECKYIRLDTELQHKIYPFNISED